MADLAEQATAPISPHNVGGDAGTYGRFVSLGVIGHGGMGVVLRARDPELDRLVAIKVLTATAGGADPLDGDWLRREAQAMARLRHPNVVQVHDVAQVGGRHFLVMELVEGTTLRRWLGEDRSVREVLPVLVGCGRGLAAAHRAGLVHRDFKPENVLLGADLRPQVGDFGLVAQGVATTDDDVRGTALATGLTVRGAVIGTPAYMAPEQWLGDDIDARTDVFALSVVAWEALFRERPFAGVTADGVRASVLAGVVRPPPRSRQVPRRLEAIVRRGLAVDRAARPSLAELLAELERPARRWPWVAAGGAAVAVAAAAGVVLASGVAASEPCPDPGRELRGVWDVAVLARIQAAFHAASPSLAGAALARVVPALDAHATGWRTAVVAACRATRVDGTQSGTLLDRRMTCLERRRHELAALTAALAAADRRQVATALEDVGELGEIAACAESERLQAEAPPADPEQRRRVDALDAELVEIRAMQFGADTGARAARARAALERARALGHVPTLVRALAQHEHAARAHGDRPTAETAVQELAQRASEARDDRLAARAWLRAVTDRSLDRKLVEARTLLPVARAAVARAGDPRDLRWAFAAASGAYHVHADEPGPAIAAFDEALALAADDVERAHARRGLATAVTQRDGAAAGLSVAETAIDAVAEAYGDAHPQVADQLHTTAQIALAAGDLARAHALETRAVAIREATLVPDSHELATSLHTLGNIVRRQGDLPAARRHFERAIAIWDRNGKPASAATTLGMLATIVAEQDGIDAARPLFVRALDGTASRAGKGSVTYLQIEANLAAYLAPARCDEATPLLAHAVEVATQVAPRRLPVLLGQGARCDQATGRPDDALRKLEQALALCGPKACDAPDRERLAFLLGTLLHELGRDRRRANALIADAERWASEHGDAALSAEIEAWRARRR